MVTLFPPLIILTILTFSSSGNAQVSGVTSSNDQAILYTSPPPPNGCPYSCLPPPPPNGCPYSCLPPPTPTDCPPPSPPPSGPSINYPPPMGYYLPPDGYILPPPLYVNGPPPPNPILPYLPFYYKNPPPPPSSDYSSAATHNVTRKFLLFTLLFIWGQ